MKKFLTVLVIALFIGLAVLIVYTAARAAEGDMSPIQTMNITASGFFETADHPGEYWSAETYTEPSYDGCNTCTCTRDYTYRDGIKYVINGGWCRCTAVMCLPPAVPDYNAPRETPQQKEWFNKMAHDQQMIIQKSFNKLKPSDFGITSTITATAIKHTEKGEAKVIQLGHLSDTTGTGWYLQDEDGTKIAIEGNHSFCFTRVNRYTQDTTVCYPAEILEDLFHREWCRIMELSISEKDYRKDCWDVKHRYTSKQLQKLRDRN